ncbi:hypothetical protein ABFV99_14135 [Cytobacillus horneckiae]|uniref:hypothetical protein n=1 Tax=Cytobacillus horneckiae TaxID=549687 RepID=UPI0034CEB267
MAISKQASKLFNRIAERGPNTVSGTASKNTINKEIRAQKELGTFLPNEAYAGNHIRTRTGGTLDGKGSFMPEQAWENLRSLQSKRPNVLGGMKNSSQNSNRQKASRRNAETRVGNGRYLDKVSPRNNMIGAIGGTAQTLFGSLRTSMKEKGALKNAGMRTVQSAAVSAAGHGGLAYLQGEDPWEAVKTGAVRGAMAGAGYQSLKMATHSNKGSIKGNMRSIGQGVKSTYQANTMRGNMALRQQTGGVSNQLKKVLEANDMHRKSKGFFGF